MDRTGWERKGLAVEDRNGLEWKGGDGSGVERTGLAGLERSGKGGNG